MVNPASIVSSCRWRFEPRAVAYVRPLATPSGLMVGEYRVVDLDRRSFDVSIPAFSLDSLDGKRTLN